MRKFLHHRKPTRAHLIVNQTAKTVERFFHIEAMSGIALIIATVIALVWANSPYSQSFIDLLNIKLIFSIGDFSLSWTLYFWINNVLMTIFFLGVGMEIRRELYEGVLSNVKQAILPLIAALGGFVIPAFIYICFNFDPARLYGWIVPTTTGVAFAVGALSLLGKSIPSNIRIILLSIAIIDCIIAIFIIAIFYSESLQLHGFFICIFALIIILFMQWIGIYNAWFYSLPGAILWWGLYQAGIQPSFAGVFLGMLTPVKPETSVNAPIERLQKAITALNHDNKEKIINSKDVNHALKEIRISQRKVLAPVTRIQTLIHPWSAYIVMPLFAFANSGVVLSGLDLHHDGAMMIMVGIIISLCFGKPIGVLAASYLAVKSGLCRLPPNISWASMLLIGVLSGIGFTTAVFISLLVFKDPNLLASAKIAVLIGSLISIIFGLTFGCYYKRHFNKQKRKK